MEWIIILLAYVANIFLNRWINKLIYRNYNETIWVGGWFLAVFGTVFFIVVYAYHLSDDLFEEKSNWFTGKNWKE